MKRSKRAAARRLYFLSVVLAVILVADSSPFVFPTNANQQKQVIPTQSDQSLQKSRETWAAPVSTQGKPKVKRQPAENANAWSSGSPQEKRQKAIELLESVLANARDVHPPEYGLLVRAEGATLLWQFDKERAVSLLSTTLEELQKLSERNESIAASPAEEAELQRIRFLVFQRIARLRPELLQKLVTAKLTTEKNRETIADEWTEEARAMVSVASELLPNDVNLAVRIAEQSIPLGRVDWTSFLRSLSEHDSGEAERLAFLLITRFRDSSVVAAVLESLKSFVLTPGRSSKLRDHFFESLVIRLRRDLQPDTPADDLQGDLYVARSLVQLAGSSPRWKTEFESLVSGFETLFDERSLPVPGSQRTRVVNTSFDVAEVGSTDDIADALGRVVTIRDSRTQDKAYRSLAVKAASKADVGLAEDILFRIKDDAVRRETTLQLYGPLVRKAINEANWTEAQKQAVKILDPLGRTMVLDNVARAMLRAGLEKFRVKEVYSLAEMRLGREMPPSRAVGQAYLVIAQSLLPLDVDAGIGAAVLGVHTLNRLSAGLVGIEEPPLASDLGLWTRVPHFYSISPGEILDLTALIDSVFSAIAKHNAEKALLLASRLEHRSLISLSHLAICKHLLAQTSHASTSSNVRNKRKN